jgi:hypothetical protein
VSFGWQLTGPQPIRGKYNMHIPSNCDLMYQIFKKEVKAFFGETSPSCHGKQ